MATEAFKAESRVRAGNPSRAEGAAELEPVETAPAWPAHNRIPVRDTTMSKQIYTDPHDVATKAIVAAGEAVADFRKELDVVHLQVGELKAAWENGAITGSVGKARGPVDYEQIGHFVKSVAARRFGAPEMSAKAAESWEISTDERGGYLVPVSVQPSIDAAMRPYGSLLSMCSFHNVAPGSTHRIPAFSTAPTSAWQLAELGALTELDIAISALERKPYAVGGYIEVSHQLFYQPSANVGRSIVGEVLNANRQEAERALVDGDAGVDAPYDGLLELAGTVSQSAAATATSALLSKFVGESIADVPSLWERGVIALSPAVAETIQADEASTAYRGRFNIDDRGGMRFGRWPVVVSPAVGLNMLMFDPAHLHVVNHGTTLLIDDKSMAKYLTVVMAMVNWYGYGVSLPGTVSKAVITNLA